MKANRRKGEGEVGGFILIMGVIFVLCVLIGGGCFGYPHYRVYSQRLDGEAEFAKSEAAKKVQISDAQAKLESSKLLSQAEVERAKGVAEANKIIGDSLKNNPEYLTYLWIQQVNADGNSVIYVPTEAGLPILEAGRTIGTGRKDEKKDDEKKPEKK